MLLAFGLQGSLALAAADRSMELDCQMSGEESSVNVHSACCRGGKTSMKCSLDICMAAITIVTAHQTPVALTGSRQSTLIAKFPLQRFSSRGDSPLIRPPIL